MPKLKIALVGFGYWGPNLARTVFQHSECELTNIWDTNPERISIAKKTFPSINCSTSIDWANCDAVMIATPIEHHYSAARQAILHQKSVLIQKPMSANSAECQSLIDLANAHGVTIMIAHTFLFSPAYTKAKQLILEGVVGKLNYIHSTRINLGLFQRKHDVIWDLAPHDFSLFEFLTGEHWLSISAVAGKHKNVLYDVANINVTYPNEVLCMAHINWLSPIKIRNLIISGDRSTILIDDNSIDKLRIYDSGIDFDESSRFLYRKGDVLVPKIEESEAIYNEISSFVEAARTLKTLFLTAVSEKMS